MIGQKINISTKRPKILIAPLDWGLGHASRCIPIIRIIIKYADVVLAGEGIVVILLQKEFPDLKVLDLKGYSVKYTTRRRFFSLKILLQVPKIFAAISREKKWLKRIVASENIDAVISDNRFGLYHKNIPCIYITHQLFIQTRNHLANKLVQKMHYRYISKFEKCWVPDNDSQDLAGALSHPPALPQIPVEYIGILSRFEKRAITKKYDFVLLISGPEPQRSVFERILLREFEGSSFSFAMVRGLPGNSLPLKLKNSSGQVFDHLPAAQLGQLIQEAETVIARAGYSTIMDLATLQQKAILVPTPGQTEQEYLAEYLMSKNMFHCVAQRDFSLTNVVEKMKNWQPDFNTVNTQMNEIVINNWLQSL